MLAIGRKVCSLLKEELRLVRSHHTNMQVAPLQSLALEEKCILVDEDDRPVGEATKKHCHLIGKDGNLPLHRAFSVFLFNDKDELLLQKRSDTKITFPNAYTNTCCSHPLADVRGESEETDALGIRRAAIRRLGYELGIPSSELSLDEFQYLTRFQYQAAGEGIWGEHEIDYVLFLQRNDLTLNPNPDEISELRWIPKGTIHDFVKNSDSPFTPWFKLMLEHWLPEWWDNLDKLHKFQNHSTIQRF